MKKKEEKVQEVRPIQKPRREKKKLETAAPGYVYKTEYCRMLLNHCRQGFSFQSFASKINVLPETLEKWTKEHPEFETARQQAELKQRMQWETMAVKACRKKFSVGIFLHFIGNIAVRKPSEPHPVVMLPEEDSSK
ncbi:MAG TPA: hypothetical protein VHO03_06865 [Ignavibacteriales bacterium]|nr:hypothetical protein [Ignavibacteriales bacterium]